MVTAIGIILIVAAIFLIVVVLMQHGKSHNLSGTIAGASETFFGKSKSSTLDRKLSVVTSAVAVVFVLLVLVLYLIMSHGTGPDDTAVTGSNNVAPGTKQETEADASDESTGSENGSDSADTSDTSSESSSDTTDPASESNGGATGSATESAGETGAPNEVG